jgi:hypothetical protein
MDVACKSHKQVTTVNLHSHSNSSSSSSEHNGAVPDNEHAMTCAYLTAMSTCHTADRPSYSTTTKEHITKQNPIQTTCPDVAAISAT